MALQQDPQASQAAIPTVNSFEETLFVRLDHCQREQPVDSTVRPSFEPEPERGPEFVPFHVPEREPQVRQLPPTPLLLFQLFVPIFLVETWVKYTNAGPQPGPEGPKKQNSREYSWRETSLGEVFIWLATLIYMGLHKETRVQDHWKTSSIGSMFPVHPILQFMSFDRFFLLQRHIRISDPTSISCGLPTPYAQVNEWSEHIQQASLALCQLGTCLAVDECIIGYTGRSKQTVTVKNKPTPTGFKVWVVAQAGYFLRWLWHQPSNALGPAGTKRKRAEGTAEGGISLNPTQSVVVALLEQLPEQTYHIFFDNLFSSPDFLNALRRLEIGATGTARINCGFYKPFVEAKKADIKGICWPWGKLETAPTPDGQVNQFAWKDNALVLFLSTVYSGEEFQERIRRRPTTTQPRARPIQRKFGAEPVLRLVVPSITADYNDRMGGVDIASFYSFGAGQVGRE
ncbi:hypothetical protein HIM_11537 [Hirsutella minnesotensis 3608]|uniref:PiggyBac transposable element-derived protein domain-containing protein n=1 Tax=Hirsutella minnesotensis 3608 TaxID=1043627 RepID=A0A0F7ZR64_9HYPO|nr:hypothetical protein HIM_11537 [Hirsutella minnesotensis 3608]